MKSTLKIVLNLEDGKTSTLTIQSPRTDLTHDDIMTFIAELTKNNAMIINSSPVIGLKKAYLQSTENQEITA